MTIALDELRGRVEDRKRILSDDLARITAQLAVMGALRVIVFGSFAEEKVRSMSDLDLIAVMPETRTGKEWRRFIPGAVEHEAGCDLLVYTERELEETIPVSSFLRQALSTGKTVYEKES
jgi:predicted nucleotidyltransferase